MKNTIMFGIIIVVIAVLIGSVIVITVDKGGNHAFNTIDKNLFEQIP